MNTQTETTSSSVSNVARDSISIEDEDDDGWNPTTEQYDTKDLAPSGDVSEEMDSDEIDYLDPTDSRNHSKNIITPINESIAFCVKNRSRNRRKRIRLDDSYISKAFDPSLPDMDDEETLREAVLQVDDIDTLHPANSDDEDYVANSDEEITDENEDDAIIHEYIEQTKDKEQKQNENQPPPLEKDTSMKK